MFEEPITTWAVLQELGLTEPALRHVLRRPGAPRPRLHPSARVFLWTAEDVERLRRFLRGELVTQGAGPDRETEKSQAEDADTQTTASRRGA